MNETSIVFLIFIGLFFAIGAFAIWMIGRRPATLTETIGTPTERREYRLLGLPLWSVTRTVDEAAIYERMRERFRVEMEAAIDKAWGKKR